MNRFAIERGFPKAERADVAAMLREYETGLGVSLSFQDFDAEVAGLPGDYAPPYGCMLLARDSVTETLAGCVALRPMPGERGVCEMKRLFVRPAARRHGLGRLLAAAIIAEAGALGYRRMGLDTLPHLREAQALYHSLGFCRAGESTSKPRVLLFELDL
jgi:putative acetyltransferase